MAMSPEDMEKRRQRRQAQLKKQRAQRRKLRLGLAAAVVVLGLCAFGIYYFVENTPQGEATVQSAIPETTASTTAPTEETSPVRESTTTIHLRAAGDLNVTDSVVDAGLAASGFDFTRAFQDVASTLSDADLTSLNLEGNIYG